MYNYYERLNENVNEVSLKNWYDILIYIYAMVISYLLFNSSL